MMEKKFWVLAVFIPAVVAGLAGYFAGLSELPANCVTLGDDTYEVVEMGRNYLENVLSRGGSGPWVGDLLQVKLEVKDPNYYWYGYPWEGEVDRPEGESTLCWIIRFEKAMRPGHLFEVWVDADSLDVVGGMQCR